MHQPHVETTDSSSDINIMSAPQTLKTSSLNNDRVEQVLSRNTVSFNKHFSVESSDFSGSVLKKLANRNTKGHLIPLAVGRPRADLYPWDSRSNRTAAVCNTLCVTSSQSLTATASNRESFKFTEFLDYGHVNGSQPLIRFLTEHMQTVHAPRYHECGTSLTCGTTSALEILLRIFCDRGTTILTEQFTYPGVVECTRLLGINIVGIDMDGEGLIPKSLERALEAWVVSQGPKPRILYTIPSGQNPTGATSSLTRKRAILAIAEKHDILVIEDDPYFFLRTDLSKQKPETTASLDEQKAITTYLNRLSQSFLSLDTSGRVIRLDSASKIIAPGLRLGWITAHQAIIDKFEAYSEVSTCGVAGPSQFMLWELFGLTWGQQGFFSWLNWLSSQYSHRLSLLLDACEAYLPKDICSWSPPMNGMFVWIKLDLSRHPDYKVGPGGISAERVENIIQSKTQRDGVMVTPGSLFDVAGSSSDPATLFFRLTCAAAADEEFDAGVRIFADVIKETFRIV